MFLAALAIGLGVTLVMLAAWGFQAWRKNAGWVDVFWTFGTGLTCALAALVAGDVLWRRMLVAALLLLWSVRLGSHIFHRVMTGAEDARYARMRKDMGQNSNAIYLAFCCLKAPSAWC
jgi:steroid 5-alpha reductase family enzyme